MSKINVFWFRRDLRLKDNAGLFHALSGERPVLPLFIFDTNILNDLDDKMDARVEFIHDCITALKEMLEEKGSTIIVKHGEPLKVWKEILDTYDLDTVYTNEDYEPYALDRDQKVKALLKENQVQFRCFKDHLIFAKNEVLKDDGEPYVVFTPYSRKWMEKLESDEPKNHPEKWISKHLAPFPSSDRLDQLYQNKPLALLSLEDLGFAKTNIKIPEKTVTRGLIRNYDQTRDYPAQEGTSRLGIHFRFGTISVREKARKAYNLNNTFLNELIWRDFYAMILFHFPHVADRSFRPKYDHIEWRNKESEFKRWCEGKTGYPIVDAGMRQLNETGYMHNRVRMITASFLTKHLLIDWRWGEAYFAKKLLDFDLASNNGGWQWAAGCGTDAAPYFRIFNPTSQQQKYDKDFKYIKSWVAEYGTGDYPEPMVNHKIARERCLKVYKEGLSQAK